MLHWLVPPHGHRAYTWPPLVATKSLSRAIAGSIRSPTASPPSSSATSRDAGTGMIEKPAPRQSDTQGDEGGPKSVLEQQKPTGGAPARSASALTWPPEYVTYTIPLVTVGAPIGYPPPQSAGGISKIQRTR